MSLSFVEHADTVSLLLMLSLFGFYLVCRRSHPRTQYWHLVILWVELRLFMTKFVGAFYGSNINELSGAARPPHPPSNRLDAPSCAILIAVSHFIHFMY